MSALIAQSLEAAFRRDPALGRNAVIEITECPRDPSRGYVYRTVRNGRVGWVRIGADVTTRDGHTPATEAAADATFRETFRLGVR